MTLNLRGITQSILFRKMVKFTIFALSVLFLTLGFYLNYWNVVDEEKFHTFEEYSESLIMGRLVESRENGLFSQAMMLGRVTQSYNPLTGAASRSFQYDMYRDNQRGDGYHRYQTHIGGQGLVLSLFDKVLPMSENRKLHFYLFLNAFLVATVISSLLFWIYKEFNFFVASTGFLAIFFSVDVTFLAKNLWWFLWVYFIPILLLLALFHKNQSDKISNYKLFIVIYLSIVLKVFLTGMDFISGVLVMMTLPIFYYGIRDSWNPKIFIERIGISIIASIMAIVSFITIIVLQIASLKNSLKAGMDYIIFSFKKRTYSTTEDLQALSVGNVDPYQNSLDATLSNVLKYYFNKPIINIHFPGSLSSFQLTATHIVIATVILSCILIFIFFKKEDTLLKRRIYAFIVITWIAFVGSLSWLVIFKSHSYIHKHMNSIVWHVPFTILAGALIGIFISVIFCIIFKKYCTKINYR